MCKANIILSGLSNAFSSGIFLGIAIFHLLPEANEGFENYFKKEKMEGFITKIPIAYFLVFFAFTLILFIEKVAFDPHSLIEHEHGHGHGNGHGHGHGHGHDHELESEHHKHSHDENKISNESKNNENDNESNTSSDSYDEVMKGVISSQDRYGSLIMEKGKGKIL